MKDFAVECKEQVEQILNDISFAPSCVDMSWIWEVKKVDGGYLIRTTFRRPDRETGTISTGYGRWWFTPDGTTLSGIVKTAFAAAKLILEHEIMESFKWQGKRVFDPHNSVIDLAALSNKS